MVEFFDLLKKIFLYPPMILNKAANALNGYSFNDSIVNQYLGYMRFAMGDTLFMLFATAALIGIAVALWSLIVKAIAWIMEIIPFA